MTALFLLASEALRHKTLWNPTLLGILVVLSAVGLFCGSVYLLLSTNLGARLGFLVAAAGLSGWMVLLTALWMTTATPLNVPKGRIPQWKVLEVVGNLGESKIPAVQAVTRKGAEIASDEFANIHPAVEGALVKAEVAANETAPEQPFARFSTSSELLAGADADLLAYVSGGGTKNLFWHHPKYAAVQFCTVKKPEVAVGAATPKAECDPGLGLSFVVLRRELGSVRQPPLFYLLGSSVLFALSLLGLHWYEKDRRARTARVTPVPATT